MATVTAQPQTGTTGSATEFAPHKPIAGCPPGLEYLVQMDTVLIHQEVEIMEVLTGCETCNKFKILNNMGQQIYYATEESETCQRLICGNYRGFVFNITDNNGQVVMRVRRPFQWFKGYSFCLCMDCDYYSTIEDSNGQILGHVSTLGWCCSPRFAIYDENLEPVAELQLTCRPSQNIICSADLDFPVVMLADESQVAMVKKTWEGVLKNCFTNADNFSVVFPANTDVKMKALLVGSVFVMDMMVFEGRNKGN